MKINIRNIRKPKITSQHGTVQSNKFFDISSLSNPLYITWGKVLKADSSMNTVNLELQNGLELRNVEVRSLEWAGANSEGYGERDLPPENCRVLILFPDGIVENAFVLCSGLDLLGEVGTKQKEELLVSGKEGEHLKIREGGLKETYDKSTGAYTLETNEAKIDIDADGAIKVSRDEGEVSIALDGVIKISKNEGEVNIASDGVISISKNGGIARINADGSVEITPASGKNIELAGNTKNLVTHAELSSALATFVTALNAHVHAGVTSGGASTAIPTPMSLNISGAEATRLETS